MKKKTKRPSRAKPCEINYAIWYCSAHKRELTEAGKCPRRASSTNTATANQITQ